MELTGESDAVARGLALLAEGVEELLFASSSPLTVAQLLQALRGVEVATRKLGAVGHQVVAQCEEQGVAVALGQRRLDVVLHQVLRISMAEARARVRAASTLGPRRSFAGQVLTPVQPCTAAAVHDGLIGVEHTRIISDLLRKIPSVVDAETVVAAEEALAGFAATMSPESLRLVGQRLLAHLDPDGRLTDDSDRVRRRRLGLGPQGADLLSELSGTLTPSCRAKLDAVFAKLACPGANTGTASAPEPGAVSTTPDDAAVAADNRTQPQRNHDALEALCDLVLGSPGLGQHRGLPVTAIITMTLSDLERATGQATTASGGTLPIRDALAMAQRAHPVLVLFDHSGRPLHLGRGRRLASADQRLALIAAEGGCTKPGCGLPADRCEVHHSIEWVRGGRTDIDELTLACPVDHAGVNDGPLGWSTAMGADPAHPGRCAWTAPDHVDPTRRPQVNHTHHPTELMRNGLRHRRRQEQRGERAAHGVDGAAQPP